MPDSVTVRQARSSDVDGWIAMRTEIWPEAPDDHPREIAEYFDSPPERWTCLLAADAAGRLVGFAEVSLRDHAARCSTSPVGYLEGIWVNPSTRASGAGRALLEAGEAWARSKGCTEMASDREIDNSASGAFHLAVGFEEVIRTVCYRKDL